MWRQPAEEDEPMPTAAVDDDEVIAALRSGDQAAFAAVTERFRRQVHVHSYRMLGSFDEADEVVQETFLRAWRARQAFEGRHCCGAGSTASRRTPALTSSCLAVRKGVDIGGELTWLQPYPDRLLEPVAPSREQPPVSARVLSTKRATSSHLDSHRDSHEVRSASAI
jgi:RNA polymerase sigma-70 factor (ECF subfamily)